MLIQQHLAVGDMILNFAHTSRSQNTVEIQALRPSVQTPDEFRYVPHHPLNHHQSRISNASGRLHGGIVGHAQVRNDVEDSESSDSSRRYGLLAVPHLPKTYVRSALRHRVPDLAGMLGSKTAL